uniref:Putative secreted protein n=1 Tax=Ixodes scapularis TaxID=6945 RepID=A0A4D5RWM3_IXOSC
MRVLLAIALAGCLLELGSCLMSPSYFASQHKSRCFVPYRDNRHVKMGQQIPAGFTMSSFLDRLELLEEKLAASPGTRPFTPIDMAAFLLRKFSYYDYTWTRLGIADMRDTNHAKELINIIMANLRDDTINPETLLDQDDICFFVFSLAHNVNSTLTYQKFDTYSANPEVQVQETTREEGVVSVTGSPDTTVAIGRTLFGIAAAHDAIQDKSIKDAIGSTTESTAGNPQTEKEALLKPIPAVTVGDVLGSSAVLHSRVQLQKNFGLTGEWLESGCMLEYKLTRATNTSATLAHIAGAIDGLILGTELKLPNSQLRNWNLSTILRTYYGPQGIQSSGNRQLTHCRRQELFNNLNNAELKQQVVYFSTALAYKGLIADNREREAKEAVDNIMGLLNNKKGDLSRFANDRDICYRITDENEPPCETPTDLYLVLDTSQDVATNEIYRKLQSEILGVITRQLKFENGGSTLRVYGSKRDGTLLQELARHSAAGGGPACAALFLTDMERNAVGADSETDDFNTLNEAITNHKKAREEMHGDASKVIVYFNLRKPTGSGSQAQNRQLSEALSRFRVTHSEVPIFAVGLKETLDALNAGSAALTVVDISQLTQLVQQEPLDLKPVKENNELKSLGKKICQVPAALQYKNSMSRDSRLRAESQATFEGFVTPRTVQYWSYDTEFYSASSYLQIKFTAGNGSPVRVCDLTGRVIDGNLAGRMCYETSNQMKAVSFNYTRPCKRGPNSCSALTFAVVGKDDAPGQQQSMTDVESCTGMCRNPQQIPFTITHEGMYGAGVLSAVFSPLMLLLTALALSRNALHS